MVLKLLNYLPHFSLIDNSAPLISWIIKALVVSGVFALMFKYIPLVPVRWRSIYFPALLTGTLFCAVQDLYVNSQLFISSYNAVYGSFAILPLLMMWLYVTWSICLGGVALCHTLEQQAQPFADERAVSLNRQMSDVVALRLMGLLARRFLAGQSAWPVHRLARELRLPVRTTFDALERLRSSGYLYRVPAAEETYGDAYRHRAVYKVDVDVHRLTVGAVLQRFDVLGTGLFGRSVWAHARKPRSLERCAHPSQRLGTFVHRRYPDFRNLTDKRTARPAKGRAVFAFQSWANTCPFSGSRLSFAPCHAFFPHQRRGSTAIGTSLRAFTSPMTKTLCKLPILSMRPSLWSTKS